MSHPAVRGKFRVNEVTRRAWNSEGAEIVLDAVYTGNPEDNTFAESTPSGKITMTITTTNADAVEKLPIGKYFYVDFIPVPEA